MRVFVRSYLVVGGLLVLLSPTESRTDEFVDDRHRLKYHMAMAKQSSTTNRVLPSYDRDFLAKNGLAFGDGWLFFAPSRAHVVIAHPAKHIYIHVAEDPHFFTKSATNPLDHEKVFYGDFRTPREVLVLDKHLKVFFSAVPDETGVQNEANGFGLIDQVYIDNGHDIFRVLNVYANGGSARADVLPSRLETLMQIHGSQHGKFSVKPADWLFFNGEHVVDWHGRIPKPKNGYEKAAPRRSDVVSAFDPDSYDLYDLPAGDSEVARTLRVTPDDLRVVELRRQLRIAKNRVKDAASIEAIAKRLDLCESQTSATIAALQTRPDGTAVALHR